MELEKDEYVADLVDVLMPVYKARGENHKISALYRHQLRVTDLDGEKAHLYKALAAHQEQAIGDLSAAFDAYATAFAIDPADGALLQELERLAEGLGAWESLVDAVEKVLIEQRTSIDSMLAVELGLRVARWAGTQLGAPAKAERFLRLVLEREPEHQEALAMLEDLLRGLGRFEELLPVMHKYAETMYDLEAKKAHLKALAEIARMELGDPRRALETYEEAYRIDEADLDVIDALCALCEELGEFERLAEPLIARAGYTTDPSVANQYRHRLATLYVGPFADPNKAADVYREILDVDLTDREASGQLESLLRQMGRYTDVRDVLFKQVEAAANSSERAAALLKLADLAETKLEDPDEAIGHLSELLLSEPNHREAFDSLVRLYARVNRWQDLVDLLQTRADHARDAGRGEEELGFLVSMGQILDEHLSDSIAATDIYEQVLERDPEHTRALTALARLYEASHEWEKCAEVLERAVRSGKGGKDEAEVHFRLARLKASRLQDEAAALEELRAAVACDPSHEEANDALAEAARKSGDHGELLGALVRSEQAMEKGPAKVARLLEIARLLRGPLGDNARAAEVLEQARRLDASNKEVLLLLCDAYVGAGQQDRAVSVLEALIEAETEGGKKRSKQAAVYHQRLALAYRGMGAEDKALANLEAAYKLDISNVEVLISLGKLHFDRGDLDQAVKLFRALLLQKFDPSAGASKADVYWYVGDIALRQGDPRKAKGMFQRGLDENREHQGCKDGLARC
ncbi:MAG: tetratricopeptide repeat protein [Myxococcota bacterium]|nr:tetratricopeptide repeat protein [Myxococcota bacterium]